MQVAKPQTGKLVMLATQIEKMSVSEKDDHYRKINIRFDDRSLLLRNMGYKYQHIPCMPVAVFVKERHGKVDAICAGSVMNADDIVWVDMFDRAYRFCQS